MYCTGKTKNQKHLVQHVSYIYLALNSLKANQPGQLPSQEEKTHVSCFMLLH